MKKILILVLFVSLFVTGCGKNNSEEVLNDFKNKVNKSKAYEIDGDMKIYSDEDIYDYSINVLHYDDNYYKVTLVNLTNDHEQIILKNNDGVYVKTQESTKQKLNVI